LTRELDYLVCRTWEFLPFTRVFLLLFFLKFKLIYIAP